MTGALRAVLLESPELDGYGQMALDEALLESPPAGLVLRFYRWTRGSLPPVREGLPYAITFGYFQDHGQAAAAAHERGWPVAFPLARRLTGGGVVCHDGDLTFSLIFPWSRLVCASLIYKDLHRGVHLGLQARGLRSRLWSPPPGARGEAPERCFAGPSPMDLVHEDGRKCLGGALRRRRGVGLYQASLRPEGFGAGLQALAEAVREGLSLEWRTLLRPEFAPEPLLRVAARLREEKYATDLWNKQGAAAWRHAYERGPRNTSAPDVRP